MNSLENNCRWKFFLKLIHLNFLIFNIDVSIVYLFILYVKFDHFFRHFISKKEDDLHNTRKSTELSHLKLLLLLSSFNF